MAGNHTRDLSNSRCALCHVSCSVATGPCRVDIREMASAYKTIASQVENAWHEQRWSTRTNDPFGHLRRSTEVNTPDASLALSACNLHVPLCVYPTLSCAGNSLGGQRTWATRPSNSQLSTRKSRSS